MTNRRTFLKLGAAAAVSVLAAEGVLTLTKNGAKGATSSPKRGHPKPLAKGGADYSPSTGVERKAVPTACWQCVTRCPAIGYVEDGRLAKIGGQPASIRTQGLICAKGQAGVNQLYDPDRVLYPMKRVGARGEGKWKRISWDEALTELAGRLKKLRDDGEPEKFMFHYGRMKGSSSKLISSVFLGTYGTKTIGNHTSICEGGKWTAQELTWGKHYDNWDIDNTHYVLNFGSNVLEAHTNHTPIAQRISRALVGHPLKMVTFDVRLSNTAAKSAEWVPIRPGTDLAVVLAMCNVIMSEDLYGRNGGEAFLDFCKATPDPNATVEQKIKALKAHLAEYTPAWAEKISGVPAKKIRDIAVEFATTHPACVISYRGAVANYNGVDTERAIQMLAAITGNVDNPGGRCKAVSASWKYPEGPKNKPKGRKLAIIDGFEGASALPTHHVSHQVLKMIKDGRAGRPEVYMWYCYAPVYSNGEVQENIDILKDESLIPYTVCINPFYDESAALADLILPDTTYLERWDWEDHVSPNQVAEYYIRQPVVEPLGEARNFADVCCDLAKRMGFPLGFKSMEDFVKKSCGLTKASGGFARLKKDGVYHDAKAEPKYYSYKKEVGAEALAADGVILDEATGVYWNWKKAKVESLEAAQAKGYADTKGAFKAYVGQKFGDKVYVGFKPDAINKSGFFELYSDILKKKNLAPLPTFTAVPEHADLKSDELILTTYKVNVQIHSRSANCKWLSEIFHENPAWINPVTAEKLGIKEGAKVVAKSAVGEIEVEVRITPAVVPGVLAISHHCGHWEYGRYASGKRSAAGSVDERHDDLKWWTNNGVHPNWIIPNSPDPVAGQQRWMDTVVKVSIRPTA